MVERTDQWFGGAKLALFLGKQLLVLERDTRADIQWPGHLDLPGGGREGDEGPIECVLRETLEETGLRLTETDLIYARSYNTPVRSWFFAAHLPASAVTHVVFGNEGRGWLLMTPQDYMCHDMAVPHLRERLAIYLKTPKR